MRSAPVFLVLALLVSAIALPGCGSYRGARLYGSGSEALAAGDLASAVADLEAAARLVPQASEVHNHLGIAYLAQGRPEAARRAFERAVTLDCSNPAAVANLRRLEVQTR